MLFEWKMKMKLSDAIVRYGHTRNETAALGGEIKMCSSLHFLQYVAYYNVSQKWNVACSCGISCFKTASFDGHRDQVTD